MIYPSRRSIVLALALAPVALAIGIILPGYWFAGTTLVIFLIALAAADGAAGPSPRRAEVTFEAPRAVAVGEAFALEVHVRIPEQADFQTEVAVDSHPLLDFPSGHRIDLDLIAGEGAATLPLTALRRGTAEIGQLWIRWRGPLGLTWKQRCIPIDAKVMIIPDIRPVQQKSAQLLDQNAAQGLVARMRVGEGAEFESLAEYRTGMDRRAIDWKQSARHTSLIAREYRTERNNNIVLAIDSGRAMGDPIEGVPRVDRAVSASLLAAYIALKEGDRVSLFGFDSHPRVSTKAVSGTISFPLLQQVASQIDYSTNETNYTLALSRLAGSLQRRSLIIIFTDFPDTISAELMLRALGPLLRQHLILFISMRDEELESLAAAPPDEPADIARAVTAAALLRQRQLVLTRLRHLGVHVLETRHDESGPAVVEGYFRMKRRGLL